MNAPASPVTWITGASGALGHAIATQLHAAGHTVVLSSRHAAALGEEAPGWYPLPLDVTDDAAVQAGAQRITARFGALDEVVACAAVPAFGDFLSLSDDTWRTAWDTKLMGAVRVVRAALPFMLARGDGRIVLVSGRGGTLAPPRHLPGASANAALNLLGPGAGQRVRAPGRARQRGGARAGGLAPSG